jgi:hypothetical protein
MSEMASRIMAGRTRRAAGKRFLWTAAAFALMGCSHPSRVSNTAQTQGNPMVPLTTLVADESAEQAQNPRTPTSTAPTATPAPAATAPAANANRVGRTAEPVAEVLVQAMLKSIQDRRVNDDGYTRISVEQVRNQSRTSRDEFDAFSMRLSEILTQASNDPKVIFVPRADGEVQYHLQGTAYLVTFEGFDLWELYLSLSRVDRNLTLWSASGPVYVMRLPQAGRPQMVVKKVK